MLARSMIAGAALCALVVGSTTLAEVPDANGPLRLTEKRYTDDAGRTLVLRFGGAEKGKAVQAQATDKQGKALEVVEIPVKDVTVCLPKAGASSAAGAQGGKGPCQPMVFVTDGASIKMGTATCTCQVYNGYLYCYGSTCG